MVNDAVGWVVAMRLIALLFLPYSKKFIRE